MHITRNNDVPCVKVVAGTHVVLMAWDMGEDGRNGLRGFAIECGLARQTVRTARR